MAASRGWEREFLAKGFSKTTVAFLRDIETVVQPQVISLDFTELEALQHEFRLLRNTLDSLTDRILDLESSVLQSLTVKEQADETVILPKVNIDLIEGRLNELEALSWLTS